jgi:hypothetical protein
MKLLENAEFESLTNTLSLQARDVWIDGRYVRVRIHYDYRTIVYSLLVAQFFVTFIDCMPQVFIQSIKSMFENCRIESYSCKMAGNDKKLYKMLNQEGHSPNDLQALSPPQTGLSTSVSPKQSQLFGSYENQTEMADACSRKMLFYLISTLNASFQPDYDFSNAKSEEFSREPSLHLVIDAIDNCLNNVLGESYGQFKFKLWAAIEEQIQLCDCTVYRY